MIQRDEAPHTNTWPAIVTCTSPGSFSSGSVNVERPDPSLVRVNSWFCAFPVT
ncbi:hypothetical protein DPMN_130069 [Dreissena polymorpha]|uniref:Uncharacterized protein n=1 Tax=Dreissena polymorpha TaxID=45954 RepID=A0A9D4H640_DREPO|nr:hypothetical protein DPMN_130069 [Dreissena polymorpha]